jgi:cytidine deaminase
VGAAVVTTDDRVYFGSNVENASYGLSLCAERAALASAVANGSVRARAMVVLTDSSPPATPCGACRQWLAELGEPDCEIICANPAGEIRRFTVPHLLPESFTLKGGNHE